MKTSTEGEKKAVPETVVENAPEEVTSETVENAAEEAAPLIVKVMPLNIEQPDDELPDAALALIARGERIAELRAKGSILADFLCQLSENCKDAMDNLSPARSDMTVSDQLSLLRELSVTAGNTGSSLVRWCDTDGAELVIALNQ